MIGVKRLQRAIADVNLGGMQTGDPKVKLKLADAQRILVELEHLEAIHESVCHKLSLISEKVGDAFIQGYLTGRVYTSDEDEADAIYLAGRYINKVLKDEQENN